MDLVQNLLIKIKKMSMDLVNGRGSMDPVHENGPWIRSKEGVHGPLVHVLSSPTWTSSKKNLPAADDCLLPPLKINEKKHELVSR